MELIFELIKETYSTDPIGQKIPHETSRQVYGDKHSITRAEWNDAGQRGLKPEFMMTMFAYDYEGEELARVGGVKYSIYRTYRKDDTIELYMEKKAGN